MTNARNDLQLLLAGDAYSGKTTNEVVTLLNAQNAAGESTAKTTLSRDATAADIVALQTALREFLKTETLAGKDRDAILATLNDSTNGCSLGEINLGREVFDADIADALKSE